MKKERVAWLGKGRRERNKLEGEEKDDTGVMRVQINFFASSNSNRAETDGWIAVASPSAYVN